MNDEIDPQATKTEPCTAKMEIPNIPRGRVSVVEKWM